MQRDLVERAQRGDREAFGVLAAASIGQLYNLAQLMLADADLASDAVQEALIAAWRDLRSLRDPDSFRAWLDRVLVRCVYRAAGRERRQVALRQILPAVEDSAPDPARTLETRDAIHRAFRGLSAEHRAVLVAHHYLELSDDEAARMLDIPTGTYKSRLHRATAAMRARARRRRSPQRAPFRRSDPMTTPRDLDRDFRILLRRAGRRPGPGRAPRHRPGRRRVDPAAAAPARRRPVAAAAVGEPSGARPEGRRGGDRPPAADRACDGAGDDRLVAQARTSVRSREAGPHRLRRERRPVRVEPRRLRAGPADLGARVRDPRRLLPGRDADRLRVGAAGLLVRRVRDAGRRAARESG